jgi:hypothetical protein
MPTNTTKFNLVKPLKSEKYNVDVFNGNADIIDSQIYSKSEVDTQFGNLTKSDVGLSNVDNTSDVDKPISTLTQNALNEISSIAKLSLDFLKVSRPSGFTFDPEFNIYKGGDRKFFTDFDIDSFAQTIGKTYYVDGVLGNNANAGTELEPFRSISHALTRSDVDIIFIKPMVYDRTISWADANPSRDITIKRWGTSGKIVSSMEHANLTWTLESGLCYRTTIVSVGGVFDANNLDTFGNYSALDLVTSIALVESTPNSYFVSGTTVYVRTFDSRVPDGNLKVYTNTRNGRFQANGKTLWMEHMHFEGGSFPLNISDTVGGEQKGYLKNCSMKYSGTSRNGVFINSGGVFYLFGCEFSSNFFDGANYDRQVVGFSPRVVEIDCFGHNNGLKHSGTTHNVTTIHNGGKILRINGIYSNSKGRVVHDIGNSESWCLGCKATKSLGTDVSSNASYGVGASGNVNCKMWLDTCNSDNSTHDIYVIDSQVFIRDFQRNSTDNINGTATVKNY